MTTVILPQLVWSVPELSAKIIKAMQAGATAQNIDESEFSLTFCNQEAADAFNETFNQ